MATIKQKAALKKARASKKMKGLGAIGTALDGVVSFKNVKSDLMQTAGIVVGFIGGQMIKQKFGDDQEGMKKYMSSLINTGVGFALMSIDEKVLAGFRPVVVGVGQGMLGSGLINGFEVITGKDILKGLEGISMKSLLGLNGEGDLSEKMNRLRSDFHAIGEPIALNVHQEYTPDLPDLGDMDLSNVENEEINDYKPTLSSAEEDEDENFSSVM